MKKKIFISFLNFIEFILIINLITINISTYKFPIQPFLQVFNKILSKNYLETYPIH